MAFFSSDDGYPAPGKVSKRRMREIKKWARKMAKSLRDAIDRDLAQTFKTS